MKCTYKTFKMYSKCALHGPSHEGLVQIYTSCFLLASKFKEYGFCLPSPESLLQILLYTLFPVNFKI